MEREIRCEWCGDNLMKPNTMNGLVWLTVCVFRKVDINSSGFQFVELCAQIEWRYVSVQMI